MGAAGPAGQLVTRAGAVLGRPEGPAELKIGFM